jgi:hypothetical protein
VARRPAALPSSQIGLTGSGAVCVARGHRAAAGWRGRPGVGEPVGIAHVGKGEGVEQGGTSGDRPRRQRDEGAVESARNGSVPVRGGGGSGDLQGPW